jgi:hypothetical protein
MQAFFDDILENLPPVTVIIDEILLLHNFVIAEYKNRYLSLISNLLIFLSFLEIEAIAIEATKIPNIH